jgi:flagellar hook assembly protein FlgD
MKNFPNPFNPSTTIQLSLPQAGEYRVSIYNITGQLIRTFDGYSEAGTVSVEWDGKDSQGNQVATGMYLYNGKSGAYSETRKMILLK